jgi:arabinogalactan oligomer/maltooligosaccharide transport system permease protein
MTTVDQAEARARTVPQVAERRRRPRKGGRNWWRHLVGLIALVFALFPVAYVASAAFSADGTLTGASLIPRECSKDFIK